MRSEHNLDALVALAELLARTRPVRELILARLTGAEEMGAALLYETVNGAPYPSTVEDTAPITGRSTMG